MTSPIEPRTASLYHASHDPAVEPVIAAAIVMAAMATYLVLPLLVPRELAMIAAQAALVVVPIAAVIATHPVRPLAALGLRGARPRFFIAAIAIGATAWYVNTQLVALLPLPARQLHQLEELVDRPALPWALAMFALVPAMCEEILFRGARMGDPSCRRISQRNQTFAKWMTCSTATYLGKSNPKAFSHQ